MSGRTAAGESDFTTNMPLPRVSKSCMIRTMDNVSTTAFVFESSMSNFFPGISFDFIG